jgi:phage shock protein A
MGIWQKLSTLIRSNINDAIAKAENPEKMLNQILLDMRDQLARAKQEVAVAIADERKLKAQAEDEQKLAADWEHRAMLAIRENRDDLAKQALIRQQEHTERAVSYAEPWQKQNSETERLKESLRQLNDKIEEAKRKKNLLVAKQKRAQAHQRIHETMAGLNDRSAFEVFDRMAEKIEQTERIAAASVEVHEAITTGDTVEREFAKLTAGAATENVEWKLLQLKEKMGLTPALPSGGNAQTGEAPKSLKPAGAPDEHVVRDAEVVDDA